MKPSSTHMRKPPSRLSSGIAATFGRVELPAAGRKSLLVLGTACLLITGAASADWRVYDDDVHNELKEINKRVGDGNVNERLKTLNDKLEIQTASQKKPNQDSTLLAEPTGEEKLDAKKPSTVSVAAADRCPKNAKNGVATQQKTLCEDIVKTEMAKYTFSMRMFKLAEERHKRLQDIEKERSSLGKEDYGDLLDNSNKLLALTALMDNDRDRYATYMQAYDARMTYLTQARSTLTTSALEGKKGLIPGGGAIVGGLVLKAALDNLQTSRRCDPDNLASCT